ncbi:MAG: FG-GAP-like repeat-containing protein [Planctomycetota bacterium]
MPNYGQGTIRMLAGLLLISSGSELAVGQAPVSLQAGNVVTVPSPRDVIVFDIDTDGYDDVVVPGGPGNVVTLLRGSPSGVLELPEFIFSPITPSDVAVGDVNGDGVADFVVSDRSDTIAVLYGGGVAPFATIAIVTAAVPLSGISLTDVDGDNDLDLVAVSELGIAVLPATAIAAPSMTPYAATLIYVVETGYPLGTRFKVADVNADGLPDLMLPRNLAQIPTIFTILDIALNSAGGYAEPMSVAGSFRGLAVGDVDSDGSVDIVESRVPSEVHVFAQMGTGPNPAVVSTLASGLGVNGPLDVGDLNGDGVHDLAVLAGSLSATTHSEIMIATGSGDGSFEPAIVVATSVEATDIRFGDFDGSGFPDLVIWNPALNQLQTFLNETAIDPLRRGDANADGTVDVADAPILLGFLFGSGVLLCLDGADVDDDSSVAITDVIFLLSYLFVSGSAAPPAPGPMNCGPDPTLDSLAVCISTCP